MHYLITYFDEIEVCNPPGAQKGVHKLGTSLYTVTVNFFCFRNVLLHDWNIQLELRATQRSIQLIACVTNTNIVKYGFEQILKTFIDDVKILAEVSEA